MSIGERIFELRKEKNISQGQLASLLDVSRQAISKWENDLSSPDTINLIKLCDILDAEVEYLATGRKSIPKSVIIQVPVVKNKEIPVEKIVEKVIEKPVVKYIENTVEKPVIQYVDRPVVQEVVRYKNRTKIVRNPFEYAITAAAGIIIGILIGLLI